jgi:1-deoxy-D-xylulose-5-phosphate synthase
VTFAAGLACEGYKPYCAIYSTFLQRAYDQVVHDVAIQSLPVRFAIDRAGLVGADGPTHAGAFDVAFLANLPNFVIMAPSDEVELCRMIATSVEINDRPSAFRYPRGEGKGLTIPVNTKPLEIGKGRIIQQGKKIAILSLGTRLDEVVKASEKIKLQYNTEITIADARFAKPIDTDLVAQLVKNHKIVLTIEEGSVGGFGSLVQQYVSEQGILPTGHRLQSMILPDCFIEHASPESMYHQAGLDADSILKILIPYLK